MARSREYSSIAEIRKALKAEGFEGSQLDPLVAFDLREKLKLILDPKRKRRKSRDWRQGDRRRVSKSPF